MGKYDFDTIINREGTNCVKHDLKTTLVQGAREDGLALWVADMDFACAPKIIEAIHKRVDRQIFGYSSNKTDDFYNAVCGGG